MIYIKTTDAYQYVFVLIHMSCANQGSAVHFWMVGELMVLIYL